MRVLHESASGERTTLATDVDVARSRLSQARGLMFRRSIPEQYALVFDFEAAGMRDVHMLFVPFPLDAVWLVDDEVVHAKRLRPWIGLGRARADTLLELPAGTASDVAVGDRIIIDG